MPFNKRLIIINNNRATRSVRSSHFYARPSEARGVQKRSDMTTLAGGFLVTNYHDRGRKVSKSSLDQGRKQKILLRQTAVDAWHG